MKAISNANGGCDIENACIAWVFNTHSISTQILSSEIDILNTKNILKRVFFFFEKKSISLAL